MKEAQLAAYLQQRMPDAQDVAVSGVARVGGGASRETWTFDARWTEDGGAKVERGFIVRRDPPASLLESNDRARVRDLHRARTAAACRCRRCYWIERDGAALDRPCFVMERLPGSSDGTGQALASLPQYAEMRPLVTKQHAEILARIHAFDIDRVPSLDRPASPAECSARTRVERWERTMRQDTLEPQPTFEMAFNWLKRHLPAAAAAPRRSCTATIAPATSSYDEIGHHRHPRLGDGARRRPDRGHRLGRA